LVQFECCDKVSRKTVLILTLKVKQVGLKVAGAQQDSALRSLFQDIDLVMSEPTLKGVGVPRKSPDFEECRGFEIRNQIRG
jgi:hypothetical protein